MRSRFAVRAVQVIALAIAVWFLYQPLSEQLRGLSREDLARWRPSAVLLAASFVLLQLVYLAHALLWRTIMRDLRIGDLSLRDTLRIYFTAGLGKYVPGKVWALAGLAVLTGRAGLPPVAATAASVLGQVGFMATGMVFLAVTFPQWRTEFDGGYGPAAAILISGLLIGGALLWFLAVSPAGRAARDRLVGRMVGRAGDRIRAAFALSDRITGRMAAMWALGYMATWVVLAVSFVLFVNAFVPVSGAERHLAGTVAASLLVGYLLPLPAGIGSRETVMVLLVGRVVPDAGAAVVIAIMSRLMFTAAELVPFALLPLLGRSVPKEDAFSA